MSRTPDILKLLQQDKVLILDGAMGTSIAEFVHDHQPAVWLNVTHPDIIYRVHTSFLNAGADIITTNTFCANAVDLRRYKMEDRVEEINRSAVETARKAIAGYQKKNPGKPCFTAGSIGPSSVSLSQQTSVTFNEMTACYQQQTAVLLSENIDLLLLETVIDRENLKAALTALRNCSSKIPAAVSFAVDAAGRHTVLGFPLTEMADLAHQFGVDILGVNCACKMAEIKAVPYLRELTRLPLMVYPNAGFPDKKGKYPVSAKQFTRILEPFIVDKSVQIAGGCCGTTPEYIAALKAVSS